VKALILGAGGQVGQALAQTAPKGVEVTALTRPECDICRPDEVRHALAAAPVDIVFNAGAFTAVDRAETEQSEAAAVNAVAPGIVAKAARLAGARTVHISTDYVFGGEGTRPYRPGDRPDPRNIYGRTKLAGEEAVRESDPAAIIVRSSWIYSSQGPNFVTNMLRLMREQDRLSVVADQIGTPTSARSLAAALWVLAGAGAQGLFHYRDSGTASWHAFAVAIQKQALALDMLDREIEIEPVLTADYPSPARRPLYSVLDAGECWRVLGRAPPRWQDNLRRTLEEIRDHG
jgi:dTDP-4-dehydrorhamnose reductase